MKQTRQILKIIILDMPFNWTEKLTLWYPWVSDVRTDALDALPLAVRICAQQVGDPWTFTLPVFSMVAQFRLACGAVLLYVLLLVGRQACTC